MASPSPAPPTTYGLSVNIYGRGDAKLGDSPSHTGISIYQHGPSTSTCEIHHVRNPSDEKYIYDPRPQPLDDPVLKGRCELATLSSEERKQEVTTLLTAFGNNEANIPEYGVGNCQDWVAGAVGMLEREGVVGSGEGAFWKSRINRSAEEMKAEYLKAGKKWIDGPVSTFEGEPDARFRDDGEKRTVGKLAHNEAFRATMQSLLRPSWVGGSDADKKPQERPYYVSSPFFSKTNEREK